MVKDIEEFVIEKGIKIPSKRRFERKSAFKRRMDKFGYYANKTRVNVLQLEKLEKKAFSNYESARIQGVTINQVFESMITNKEFLKIDYSREIEEIYRDSLQKLQKAKNLFDRSKKLFN